MSPSLVVVYTVRSYLSTLSLHDALPISASCRAHQSHLRTVGTAVLRRDLAVQGLEALRDDGGVARSEEHTSELQSHSELVCRLLLEKKKRSYYPSLTHADQSHYARLPPH